MPKKSFKKVYKKIVGIIAFLLLLTLPLVLYKFKEFKILISQAFYTKAKISVNATEIDPDNYILNWLSFAQGGEEPGKDMLQAVSKDLSKVNPQYIRLDHIFDDDYYGVYKKSEQGAIYNFSRLDQAVDTILNTGAKPMLVLSYMPNSMASNKIDPPYNWTEWQNLVKTTIEHYSGFNNKNISNVYYEIWNEPDLESFGGFKYYGDKNYLDLYYHSAIVIKNIHWTNPFKIGGPATTDLYENWIKALLDFCLKNKLPLGFLSYHQYGNDPNKFLNNANKIKSYLKKYPKFKNTEVLLTEWGHDSNKNPSYNTNLAAAFALSTISEVNKNINKAFAFEVKDGPTTNSWGMIGHESKLWLKPRYSAYLWLAELKQALIFNGNGSFVKGIAGKNNKKIIVLLSNYDHNASHQELVPVRIANLKPGRFQFKKQYLGKSKVSEELNLTSSVFSREFYLPANSVLKLELIPL